MTSRKRPRRTTKKTIDDRTHLQQWVDEYGHGAQTYLENETGLRWQTIHDLLMRRRNALPESAVLIETATKGAVPWASLVRGNKINGAA